jgi:hypothetical protein
MKHLMTFEMGIGLHIYGDEDDRLNFIYKKGDYVILLEDDDEQVEDGFNVDDIYKIITVDKNDYEIPYEISWLTSDKNSIWVGEGQLRLAEPYEIQSKKYNL